MGNPGIEGVGQEVEPHKLKVKNYYNEVHNFLLVRCECFERVFICAFKDPNEEPQHQGKNQ